MSKLIDKLKLVSPAAPQPMGFGRGQPAPTKPVMLLIASLTRANADSLADYVSGADAGLWHISSGSEIKTLNQAAKTAPDIPWGWWLADNSGGEITQVLKTGADFVIFPANTPLVMPQDEVGQILQVEASLSEGLLHSTNDLPVDAVLVTSETGEGHTLTWHHLMLFQRAANLLTKPLLAAIPANTSPPELQALCDAGVGAVIVEVTTDQPAGRLNDLRQRINQLSLPSSRPQRKIAPLLPHLGGDTDLTSEDEEEYPD